MIAPGPGPAYGAPQQSIIQPGPARVPARPIAYQSEPQLSAEAFIDLLHRSGLAARRPVEDGERIAAMLANAGLVLTAREADGRLVGVARCLSDMAYVCYASDLAVCRSAQGRGIGTGLLAELRRRIHPRARLFLLSAPDAVSYYEHLGLARHPHCFDIPAGFAAARSQERDSP